MNKIITFKKIKALLTKVAFNPKNDPGIVELIPFVDHKYWVGAAIAKLKEAESQDDKFKSVVYAIRFIVIWYLLDESRRPSSQDS